MNKKRLILTICSLILYASSNAQNVRKDTFSIKEEYKISCLNNYKLIISGGKYYYNNKEIDKATYMKMDRFVESICDSLLDKAQGNYCKFYNANSIVVEEGIWHREFFEGAYKSYYDNGIVKSKGIYSSTGVRRGKWMYYDKKGKLKKTIDYK